MTLNSKRQWRGYFSPWWATTENSKREKKDPSFPFPRKTKGVRRTPEPFQLPSPRGRTNGSADATCCECTYFFPARRRISRVFMEQGSFEKDELLGSNSSIVYAHGVFYVNQDSAAEWHRPLYQKTGGALPRRFIPLEIHFAMKRTSFRPKPCPLHDTGWFSSQCLGGCTECAQAALGFDAFLKSSRIIKVE